MAASDSDRKLEQPESLNCICGLSLRGEGKTPRRSMWILHQMVSASEFRIISPAAPAPGFGPHFGDNEDCERDPHVCLELDQGSGSSP